MLQGLVDTLFGDDVVSGDVSVAGVDAGSDGNDAAETVDDFGDLFEAASERKFRAGGVFDEDGESSLREVQALRGGGDGGGGLKQAGFAIGAAEGTGMENQIVGADRKGALDFSAEGFDGFLEKEFVGAGEVYQVIGVNHERLQVVASSQLQHLFAQGIAEFVGRPLAGAGGENLQGVAAETVGAFGGVVNASGGGGMDADTSGSETGRAFRGAAGEDVLFAGDGAGHKESIKRRGIGLGCENSDRHFPEIEKRGRGRPRHTVTL